MSWAARMRLSPYVLTTHSTLGAYNTIELKLTGVLGLGHTRRLLARSRARAIARSGHCFPRLARRGRRRFVFVAADHLAGDHASGEVRRHERGHGHRVCSLCCSVSSSLFFSKEAPSMTRLLTIDPSQGSNNRRCHHNTFDMAMGLLLQPTLLRFRYRADPGFLAKDSISRPHHSPTA
jgi:hypothetical protein